MIAFEAFYMDIGHRFECFIFFLIHFDLELSALEILLFAVILI